MNEEVKELINELKEVVMRLHRSAGNLDNIVQCLGKYEDGLPSTEYLNVFIKSQAMYRDTFKAALIRDIDNDELTIWNALIQITEKKEP